MKVSLTNEIAYVEASLMDIKKYIVPAYETTFENIKKSGQIAEHPFHPADNEICFDVEESELDNLRQEILLNFLNNIRKNLKLEKNEGVFYGEETNAYGIGNNVALPIIVQTKTKKISFGYMNANHDMYANRKSFYLTDNTNDQLDVTTWKINADAMHY